MANPRELALKSLIKYEENAVFSNLEINTTLTREGKDLSPKDKGLYTALFLGVIEKKMLLDHIIGQYSKIPLDEIDITELNILRLGIYQLHLMDKIPEYSATNECVSLARKRSKGFINAVLRSFIREKMAYTLPDDKWERVSVFHSYPMEIIDILRSSYGDSVAYDLITKEKVAEELSLRVNTEKTSCEEIIKALGCGTVSAYTNDIVKCNLPISEVLELISKGLVFVQDEASRICSVAVDTRPNLRVLDACACPGGKTFSMALDMKNEGSILACDLHESKLSLITKSAKNLGLDIIEVRAQNGKEYVSEMDSAFDRVLCDVPCSGLGIILKKPDIKYKSYESINNLPTVQYDILSNCARYVKVGGILVYSTCTINKKENEENVCRFLKENENFESVDFEIGQAVSKNGMRTFLPHIDGTDGFFISKMKRVK